MNTTYTVIAKRDAAFGGWELHIDGVGVTQSYGLHDLDLMVRDYIVLDRGAHDFDIEVEVEVSPALDRKVKAARRATTEAAELAEAAARRSREAARQLREAGLTGRDIAAVLKVSPQRVSQLLRS